MSTTDTVAPENTKTEALPRLSARFCPEWWSNNQALPAGPDEEFDAAPVLLSMSADHFRSICCEMRISYGRNLDLVAEYAGLTDQHQGPFTVRVDADSDEFKGWLSVLGIDKAEAVTDADLQALRRRYAIPEIQRLASGAPAVIDGVPDRLVEALRELGDSADDEGCTGGLVVVDGAALAKVLRLAGIRPSAISAANSQDPA